MNPLEHFLKNWQAWIWPAGVLAAAVFIALLVHAVLFFLLGRLERRKGDVLVTSLVHHARGPARWVLPLLALVVVLPGSRLPENVKTAFDRIAGLGLIATVAWVVILFVLVASDIVGARYRVDIADNLRARTVHTQLGVLNRIAVTIVVVVAVSIMLMTFPAIQHIGMSLLASAGLAGLIVGMAMKSTLSNVIAGIQVALTQPIRLEDVVVVENDWGWIEEIGTTYVVVRIWDLRRLVLPLSYFIEHPFENWTRNQANLLGSVLLYVDYSAPIEELRKELNRIVRTTKLWKGEVCALQATDATENTMQIRALVDARDSNDAWDLRCYVREQLIQFLQEKYPEALPRRRAEISGVAAQEVAQPLRRRA